MATTVSGVTQSLVWVTRCDECYRRAIEFSAEKPRPPRGWVQMASLIGDQVLCQWCFDAIIVSRDLVDPATGREPEPSDGPPWVIEIPHESHLPIKPIRGMAG